MNTTAVGFSQQAHSRKRGRMLRVAAVAVAVALLTAGCTGGGVTQSDYSTDTPVTISFWHGWSLPNDLAALQANIDAFEKQHPNITVKMTPNISDDKILQGLRSSNGPDVISSFTATSVGALCNGALIDLNPKLEADKIDKKSTFIASRIDYTQYNHNQCTLPLLGDALGLYYNTEMFQAAGITEPPKTWTEFTADAVKLTNASNGSYDPLGFMASFQGYESDIGSWMTQWAPTYFDENGKSNLANDPQVTAFFEYTKSLADALGGYDKLRTYRTSFGEEFSAQNPFEVGKVAMAFDGEWRIGNIIGDNSTVPYAVAPLPVPDDKLDSYGKGFLTGTVIGISARSRHQEAAWQLTKFLTTDTDALVSFGNAIRNLPSTQAAAASPDLPSDASFQTFLDISKNPDSASTPPSANGGEFLTILGHFGEKWEAGQVSDLHQGLVDVDKQIDAANAQTAG